MRKVRIGDQRKIVHFQHRIRGGEQHRHSRQAGLPAG
jgi:hypothetical protein